MGSFLLGMPRHGVYFWRKIERYPIFLQSRNSMTDISPTHVSGVSIFFHHVVDGTYTKSRLACSKFSETYPNKWKNRILCRILPECVDPKPVHKIVKDKVALFGRNHRHSLFFNHPDKHVIPDSFA